MYLQLAEVQNLLLPAAAVEPPWLRRSCVSLEDCWFDTAAWSKVVQALQLLLTRYIIADMLAIF